MFVVITETEGTLGCCALRMESPAYGGIARCRASKTWCIVGKDEKSDNKDLHDLECPFDKHDTIQLEYRKISDG